MSSLLKALKQQQSPLVRQRSDIDPALIEKRSAQVPLNRWLLGVVLLLSVLMLATASLQWFERSSPASQVDQQPAVGESYQLGQSLAVANVQWQATPKPEPSSQGSEAITRELAPTQTAPSNNEQRQPIDLNQVSPELLAKFEQAVAQSRDSASGADDNSSSVVPTLQQLNSDFQRRVPQFSYDGHMYVSDPTQRWIELNGQRLFIGDQFGRIRVERIEPQRVVLSLDSQAFGVEALRDWSGQ